MEKKDKNTFFSVAFRAFTVTLSAVSLILIGYFTAAAFFGG